MSIYTDKVCTLFGYRILEGVALAWPPSLKRNPPTMHAYRLGSKRCWRADSQEAINALNEKLLVTQLVQRNGLLFSMLYIILTKYRWIDVLQFCRTIFHAKLGRMHLINYNNRYIRIRFGYPILSIHSLHVILVNNVSCTCWGLVVFARACSCKYHVLRLWKYNLYSEFVSLQYWWVFFSLSFTLFIRNLLINKHW